MRLGIEKGRSELVFDSFIFSLEMFSLFLCVD